MQRRLIYKIFTGSLVLGLLTATVVTADSDTEKSLRKYSPQLLAGQWNPWLLPEAAEKAMGFQCPTDWQNKQTQGKSMDRQGQVQAPEYKNRLSGRFVTPGILESLKQQQIQTQMTPAYEPYRQPGSRQFMPQQPVTRLPEKKHYYGEPAYGMGSANPLYDAPTVSPWGSGADVIYRGGSVSESFSSGLPGPSPWVPSEAIGGLPPIHIPPYEAGSNLKELESADLNKAETGNVESRKGNNVFNPFTFSPNRSWP